MLQTLSPPQPHLCICSVCIIGNSPWRKGTASIKFHQCMWFSTAELLVLGIAWPAVNWKAELAGSSCGEASNGDRLSQLPSRASRSHWCQVLNAQHEGYGDRKGKQLAGENEVQEQHKDIHKDCSTIPSMLLRGSITLNGSRTQIQSWRKHKVTEQLQTPHSFSTVKLWNKRRDPQSVGFPAADF